MVDPNYYHSFTKKRKGEGKKKQEMKKERKPFHKNTKKQEK